MQWDGTAQAFPISGIRSEIPVTISAIWWSFTEKGKSVSGVGRQYDGCAREIEAHIIAFIARDSFAFG
jgi:hypothetical protein